ncbi:LOW QUALITY PROTEIN: coiled-coil domain-containing protein 42 like-2 [Cottoperca gobio]|uniref:LOW QUALITY PROTEIN: coiled-coil domain-containing protein 42 like-2 n=1 Tax=Cottoperca gobio TaxID=56716 RepID=A0A6J2QET3_COTGO|nr:LOW QUALITY PROTEIN: cilia- and flagella-associated protein 73 [Cottoperca gobio]
MASSSARQKRSSQRLPAGVSGEVTAGPLRDRSTDLIDLQKQLRENEELDTKCKERKEMLQNLQKRKVELQEEYERLSEEHLSFDTFLKVDAADQLSDKAERERNKVLQLEAELKRQRLEYVELMERKQELQRQMQSHSVYSDFMSQVVKLTKYDDVQGLTSQLENLLHFRDHLYQKESTAQEQVDELRKALLSLRDQHHFLRLHKNNQLSQLHTELEKTRSDALTWERKWNHIQETAAKETLQLGQIKMATLNLYEMTDEKEGEEAVDVNDTEKQLDKIKMFIQDHSDILKQYQTPSQRQDDQKKCKPKKRIPTCKKHALFPS